MADDFDGVPYIDPTDEQGRDLITSGHVGPVTMLNLIRFRPFADYTSAPELAPSAPITGRQAYEKYAAHTAPFLRAEGGLVTFLGEGGSAFIGPANERWDLVMLVRHASLDRFLAMATNAEYLAGVGHRTAALADSRLLPIRETKPKIPVLR